MVKNVTFCLRPYAKHAPKFILGLLILLYFPSCTGDASEHGQLPEVELTPTAFGESVLLKKPEALSIARNGDLYLVDVGYEKPILRLSPNGDLIEAYGEFGGGPGELGSVRDILAPSRFSDSTYVFEFDKRAILVYKDTTFVRQFSLPGEGYPRFANYTESGNVVLGYANDYTLSREFSPTTGRWLDTTLMKTFPANLFHRLPPGTEMDFFKGYVLKNDFNNKTYVFAMRADVLQIFQPDVSPKAKYILGPEYYQPEWSEKSSGRPENRFRAFGNPCAICGDKILVSYSGTYKTSETPKYFQSKSILVFDTEKQAYTKKVKIGSKMRWNIGAIDCTRDVIYLIDQNEERAGASIFKLAVSDIIN